jgi:hypothetical protein
MFVYQQHSCRHVDSQYYTLSRRESIASGCMREGVAAGHVSYSVSHLLDIRRCAVELEEYE